MRKATKSLVVKRGGIKQQYEYTPTMELPRAGRSSGAYSKDAMKNKMHKSTPKLKSKSKASPTIPPPCDEIPNMLLDRFAGYLPHKQEQRRKYGSPTCTSSESESESPTNMRKSCAAMKPSEHV